MKKMKIEIWSDIACPYCYIGKRKMDKVLSQFAHKDEIELVWHSYELNPGLPKQASKQTFAEYFAQSHGISCAEVKANFAELTKLAKEAGLDYHLDKLIVANTSDALRLVKLANESGRATEAEEALFDAYFVRGMDVSDRKTLLKLGKQIGLEAEQVTLLLDTDKYSNDIQKDVDYSDNELNLEFIPFYRINGKQIIQGSIAVEDYLKVLNKAYDEWKTGKSSGGDAVVNGKSCSIDGVCSI